MKMARLCPSPHRHHPPQTDQTQHNLIILHTHHLLTPSNSVEPKESKMADTWDDSDDDWDKSEDEDELDKRLGLAKIDDAPPVFDDEEDLTLKEKERNAKADKLILKTKGSALAKKKAADAAAKEELELARKAMAMEAEMEANMTPDERRLMEREREEADAQAMADDLFGGVDAVASGPMGGPGKAMMSGDKVVMKDLKDHLRHAKKVGECIQVSVWGSIGVEWWREFCI